VNHPFDMLEKQPRWLLFAEAILLVFVIGIIDFRTGYELSMYVFYSVPILLVVWFAGRNGGLWISIFSALVWSTADIVGRSYEVNLERLWNMTVQLTFFIFIVLGGAALKGQRDESRARVELLERFHALAQVSPVGIFRAGLSGGLVYVNERWRQMAGLPGDLRLPMMWTDAFHPDDRARVSAEWAKAVTTRGQCEFEARFQHPDGKTIWVLGRVAPEGDGQGGTSGYVGAVTDMTELRRLEREILEISEREQERIGQDLHDDLGQQLVAIQYSAAALKKELQVSAPPTAAAVGAIVDLLKAVIIQARQMARRIFPVHLDQAGLMTALQELAANSSRLSEIDCRFVCPVPIFLEESTPGTHLFRIAQEALSNAVRHAGAKVVTIGLSAEAHQIMLTVQDDGRGLPANAMESGGMGLHIMHYRSRMIGATLRLEPNPAGGTVVRCVLPQRGSKLRELIEAGAPTISVYER
jgi:PAS domain S-box-containing protein